MKRLSLLVLAVLLLATAACGSRAESSDDPDDGLGGGTTEAEEPGGADGIEHPCTDEPAEGEAPADVPGVSDDTIRIGVISDRENPAVPLPTVGIEEAVKAFVQMCNDSGGINGRQLELVTYDSQIGRVDDVTKEACADDLFALVGSGSVQDQLGIESRLGCGLPEVAAYAATEERGSSEDFFVPLPASGTGQFNVGACVHLAEEHPDAAGSAAMVAVDLPASAGRGDAIVAGCEAEAGLDFTVHSALPFGTTNFGPVVSQMKSAGVTWFSSVSVVAETLSLLREAQQQEVGIEVVNLEAQYYDPAFAEDPVADGAYVWTSVVPLEEGDEDPAMGAYLELVEEQGGTPSSLGVQAFSAGLLFATAASELGADLTREGLVEELRGITSWEGGGLHAPGNPGENQQPECILLMRVSDGGFVRDFPEEGFACDPEWVIDA